MNEPSEVTGHRNGYEGVTGLENEKELLAPSDVWYKVGESTSDVTFYWGYSEKDEYQVEEFELQLRQSGTTDTELRPVKVAGDTTSYTFYGLIPGQTYTMTITAIVSDQVRSKPKETQITITPEPVTNLQASQTQTGVTLTWETDPNSHQDGFKVRNRSSHSAWSPALFVSEKSKVYADLLPGVMYEFEVWAISGQKESGKNSVSVEVGSAPTQVTNFKVHQTIHSQTGVTLVWDTETNAVVDGYRVRYRGTGPSSTWSPADQVVRKMHQYPGLTVGEKYKFEVWAFRGEQESEKKSYTLALEHFTPVPIWKEDDPSTSELTFSWDYWGHDEYDTKQFALELRRKGCTNIEQGPVMVASDTTRYTFHGLVPGQAYTMKLTVVTSEQACGEPKEADGTVAPKSVMSLQVIPVQKDGVRLTWETDPNSQQDKFRVRYKGTHSPAWSPPLFVNEKSKDYTALPPGGMYEFEVWAVSGQKEGDKKSVAKAFAPKAVTSLKAFPTQTGVTLTWDSDSHEDGFRVRYRGTHMTDWSPTLDISEKSKAYTDLVPGEMYEFEVWAVSGVSEGAKKSVTLTVELLPPTGVWCTQEDDACDVTFHWRYPGVDACPPEQFELQLKKNGTTDTEQRPVKVAGDTTSYTFYGLIPGQTYTMTITAIMSDQVRSKPKETQVTVDPLAPTDVWYTEDEDTSDLTFYWKYPEEYTWPVKQFELQLKRNGSTDTEQRPVKVPGDTTSFTFYGLIPGQTCTMTITAIMSDQVRSKPKESEITIKPFAPTDIWYNEEENTSDLTFHWSYPRGAEEFELELRRMGSTNTEQRPVRVAGDTTSFTFCGLIPGQTYTMTITAIVSDQVRSKPKDTQATVSAIQAKVEDFPNSENCPWEKKEVLREVNSKCKVIKQMFNPKAIEKDNEDVHKTVLDAKAGDFSKAFKIIKEKPNLVNAIPAERAWSVLHQAVYMNNVGAVQRILSLPNCDPNIKAKRDRAGIGKAGMTPLQLAERMGNRCQMLLEDHDKGKTVEEVTYLSLTDDGTLPFVSVPYYDIAAAFLKTDLLKKITCDGSDFTTMSEKMYDLVESDWEYVRCAIAECLYPFDKVLAEKLRSVQFKDELKEVIVWIYTNNSVHNQVNAALRRTSNTDFPVGDDLLLSLYSLFFHSILLYWDKLTKVTQTTYRGVVLPADQADKYKEGVAFCWLPFTSSCLKPEAAKQFWKAGSDGLHPAVFEIDNRQASEWSPRNIASMSRYKGEGEAIYPSGARFQVTRVQQMAKYTKYTIKLL